MSRENFTSYDPSEFSDPIGSRDLQSNSLREGLSVDKWAGQTDFNVIILTKPLPYNTGQVNAVVGGVTTDENDTGKGSIYFHGRIHSCPGVPGILTPHSCFGDPCALSIASDPLAAAMLAKQHTIFISSETWSAESLPNVGDIVSVSLSTGWSKYNLQYAKFTKLEYPSGGAAGERNLGQSCGSLKIIFDNFDVDTLGTLDSSDFGQSSLGSNTDTAVSPYQHPERSNIIRTPFQPSILPNTEPAQFPTAGTITSLFTHFRQLTVNGRAIDGPHPGLDIGADAGTPVYSALNHGRVTVSDFNDSSGHHVKITHTFSSGQVIITSYSHLLSQPDVGVGDSVNMATKIGEVGSTGISSGPHLHWEVFEDSWTLRHRLYEGGPLDPSKANHRDPIQALGLYDQVANHTSHSRQVTPRSDQSQIATNTTTTNDE